MWATTNHHTEIAKLLLDNGASLESKTATGKTAWEFVALDPDISGFALGHGYVAGDAGAGGDYYDTGFLDDHLEDEMVEQDMRRRLLMESALNLEVDLASLGMNERAEVSVTRSTSLDLVLIKAVA